MRDLNTGFAYRSSWTGYVRGQGLDITNAPVLHSARIDSKQVYDDPSKGPQIGTCDDAASLLPFRLAQCKSHATPTH